MIRLVALPPYIMIKNQHTFSRRVSATEFIVSSLHGDIVSCVGIMDALTQWCEFDDVRCHPLFSFMSMKLWHCIVSPHWMKNVSTLKWPSRNCDDDISIGSLYFHHLSIMIELFYHPVVFVKGNDWSFVCFFWRIHESNDRLPICIVIVEREEMHCLFERTAWEQISASIDTMDRWLLNGLSLLLRLFHLARWTLALSVAVEVTAAVKKCCHCCQQRPRRGWREQTEDACPDCNDGGVTTRRNLLFLRHHVAVQFCRRRFTEQICLLAMLFSSLSWRWLERL